MSLIWRQQNVKPCLHLDWSSSPVTSQPSGMLTLPHIPASLLSPLLQSIRTGWLTRKSPTECQLVSAPPHSCCGLPNHQLIFSWFWNPEGNAETEPDPGVNHSWASKMKGSLQLDTVLQGTRNTGNRHRNSYHQPFKECLCNRPVCYGEAWAPQRKET